jgi:predicted metalloprotease with PDZ domain
MRVIPILPLLVLAVARGAASPSIAYDLSMDAQHLDVAAVAIHLSGAPEHFHIAMKVHPEYDARYWRFIDSIRVDGTSDDRAARISRADSTLWNVSLPGGRGTIHYLVHIQPSPRPRRAWMPFAAPTGALINPPDFFLYVPELANERTTVDLTVPRTWRVATSLAARGSPSHLSASNAAVLLDSPILLGELREWSFRDRGTTFHVDYWPLPNAAPFDTIAFVDQLKRFTAATLDIFHRAPTADFHFLIQDGAGDALEHAASVTLGVPSARLAANPHALLPEIAHEFFHTWNLVAIHPDEYGSLDYRPARRTTGLWWGEGVTIYYADALGRRAGLTPPRDRRVDHLESLLGAYYAASWRGRVSPERASQSLGDSPVSNPDATGSYYQQGELLGNVLDALVRDSTRDRRGLDDVMRALFDRSASGRGFTSNELESVVDSVCHCDAGGEFREQVRGPGTIDIRPVLERLGWRLVVDTVTATDTIGASLPDARITIDYTNLGPPLTLVVNNPASAWAKSGVRTGDRLLTLNGHTIAAAADFQRAQRALRLGDTIAVTVERNGSRLDIHVPITSYTQPRVRIVDAVAPTATQLARRQRWLAGW